MWRITVALYLSDLYMSKKFSFVIISIPSTSTKDAVTAADSGLFQFFHLKASVSICEY